MQWIKSQYLLALDTHLLDNIYGHLTFSVD